MNHPAAANLSGGGRKQDELGKPAAKLSGGKTSSRDELEAALVLSSMPSSPAVPGAPHSSGRQQVPRRPSRKRRINFSGQYSDSVRALAATYRYYTPECYIKGDDGSPASVTAVQIEHIAKKAKKKLMLRALVFALEDVL